MKCTTSVSVEKNIGIESTTSRERLHSQLCPKSSYIPEIRHDAPNGQICRDNASYRNFTLSVAAMMRTLTFNGCELPSLSTSRSCRTRSSFTCARTSAILADSNGMEPVILTNGAAPKDYCRPTSLL